MDELRLDKKVEGIAEVRDETDRTGLRIVVELKKMQMPKEYFTIFIKIRICKYRITLTWLPLLKSDQSL